MKIYFAGAIRGGREDVALYLEIVKVLRAYGKVLTEHVAAADLSVLGESKDDRWIHDRDLAWLRDADCLVAEVTTPSLGVGFEIGKATEWRKRVLCLFRPSNNHRLSALIAGCELLTLCEYQNVADLTLVFDEFFASSDCGGKANAVLAT
jgi:nucleoside 2-deoxyribosyltransferase